MGKLGFTASTLTSAAAAFGLGALTFSGHAAAADADAQPQPTQTVTAPATAPDKAAKAGSKGPFKDAQGDGKYLDDVAKTFVPNGVGAYVPDAWLPVGHAVAN
jgi:hypothetical protein